MSENKNKYVILVAPLPEEDGGGYIARVPDLPGCFGDGDTREAAISDAALAIEEWAEEYSKMGRSVPKPGSAAEEYKKKRNEELRFLTDCVEKLRSSEKELEGLDDRIAAVEKELGYLADLVENSDGWTRFHVIMKTTERPDTELLC